MHFSSHALKKCRRDVIHFKPVKEVWKDQKRKCCLWYMYWTKEVQILCQTILGYKLLYEVEFHKAGW